MEVRISHKKKVGKGTCAICQARKIGEEKALANGRIYKADKERTNDRQRDQGKKTEIRVKLLQSGITVIKDSEG